MRGRGRAAAAYVRAEVVAQLLGEDDVLAHEERHRAPRLVRLLLSGGGEAEEEEEDGAEHFLLGFFL